MGYNRARYYHYDLGRFIQRDPIDIADDVNLYTYVANNPLIYTDRMGLEKSSVYLKNSDATERFLEFIEKGKKFQYTNRYQPEHTLDFVIGDITLQGPTFSDTYLSYLNATKPGGEFDLKRSDYFKIGTNKANDQLVGLNQKSYRTNELGNFFVGLNGQRTGLTLNEINNYGFGVEIYQSRKDFTKLDVLDEVYDQKFYKAGYVYGLLETSGNFSQSELDNSSFYLLNKAKNEK